MNTPRIDEFQVDIQYKDGQYLKGFEFPFRGSRVDAINYALSLDGCAGGISNGYQQFFYKFGFLDNPNTLGLRSNLVKRPDYFR